MTPRARGARVFVGVGSLALGAAALYLLGIVWVVLIGALIPAWIGVTHLVASVTGYQGCPELGAVPTLILRRRVATNCTVWNWIDHLTGADRPGAGLCGCAGRGA